MRSCRSALRDGDLDPAYEPASGSARGVGRIAASAWVSSTGEAISPSSRLPRPTPVLLIVDRAGRSSPPRASGSTPPTWLRSRLTSPTPSADSGTGPSTSPRPTACPPPGWTWSPGCCSRRPRPELSPTADADRPAASARVRDLFGVAWPVSAVFRFQREFHQMRTRDGLLPCVSIDGTPVR